MPQSTNLGAIANVAGATFRLDSNAAFQALASSSSGASAPDPTYPFQLWWDTSASPHLLKQRTPANNGWVIVGEWTGSHYRPRRDGVALGTAAVEAAGSGANQLVKLDANARLPALDASQLLNLPAVSATGDLRLTLESSAPSGWLFCDGQSLGTVASGANHAGVAYEALFAYLWERVTNAWCPIFTSGGGGTTRGASAADDWAANKRLALPDARGSVALFRDSMGGTAAGRVTSASTGGANASAMAARGGAQTETLTVNHLPSHDHGGTTGTGGAHTHTYDKLQDGSYPGYVLNETGYAHPLPANIASSGAHNHTIGAQGGGQGHSSMPPWFSLGLIIKS